MTRRFVASGPRCEMFPTGRKRHGVGVGVGARAHPGGLRQPNGLRRPYNLPRLYCVHCADPMACDGTKSMACADLVLCADPLGCAGLVSAHADLIDPPASTPCFAPTPWPPRNP